MNLNKLRERVKAKKHVTLIHIPGFHVAWMGWEFALNPPFFYHSIAGHYVWIGPIEIGVD